MTRVAPPSESGSQPQLVSVETILPAAMALRAEENGVKRASMDPVALFVLSVLAGALISFGAIFATAVSSGAAALPYGVVRLLTGLAFSVGLIMVVVAGAELFTGNNMIVMAWASRKVTTRALLVNWAIAYLGNCVGALATAGMIFLSQQYTFGGGAVGLAALATANAKAGLAFGPALILGILCNALVCLAVWMCYAARTTVDPAGRIVHQGRRPGFILESDRQDARRLRRPDLDAFPARQPSSRDHRQYYRRFRDGRGGLLVHLSPPGHAVRPRIINIKK